ncbi:hypothetical protein GCM10009122_14240 [Fulvivirga kasyanovii]|uniref:Uncharacterized protein n=1 Tax=Fulvivirga kasyanovii TaxID=396812 RepID=A0ABW9RJP6_9BACT|nr:hypothetical protein [Fulvivirga kasyanovii]MTI23643.1 hypothetical protein [Fulvivirga kasyanovii]
MLGLFKRTKIKDWEVILMKEVFQALDDNFISFRNQLKDGLLRGVRIYSNDPSHYIGFKYTPDVAEKYLDETKEDFSIEGIQVYDEILSKYIDFIIYTTHGLICGYSTPASDKPKFNINKIKLDGVKKVYLNNLDFENVKNLFNESELKLINPSEVYEVELEGKKYYHLKDLEDGDFIGIDTEKRVYKFTHDPYEIKLLGVDLSSVLNSK